MAGRVKLWRYAGKKVDPFYLSRAWKRIRVHVLLRDNAQCQVCRKRWANTVHHIKPRQDYPELALEESNLEAICAFCHNREHPEKGRGQPGEAPGTPAGIRIIRV